jgi:negative regulator of flagellin synthesis FlgM
MAVDITGLGASNPAKVGENSTKNRVDDGNGQTTRSNNQAQQHADVVTITPSAAKLQAVEQKLASIPVVDQARVDQLRNAIESGQYKVDPQRTAEKLLQMESALHR